MSKCKHDFIELEHNCFFLECAKCKAWIGVNDYPLYEAKQRIKELESALRDFVGALKDPHMYVPNEHNNLANITLEKHAELIKQLEGEK